MMAKVFRSRLALVVLLVAAAVGGAIVVPLATRSRVEAPPPAIAMRLPEGYVSKPVPPVDAAALAGAAKEATGARSAAVLQVFGPGDDLGTRVVQLDFDHPADPGAVAAQLSSIGPTTDERATTIDGVVVFVRRGNDDVLDASAMRAAGNRLQLVLGGTNDQVRIVLQAIIAGSPTR